MDKKVMSRFPLLVSQKEVREQRMHRYSQKEIAQQTGVSESVVSRWMTGKGFEGTSIEVAGRLARWVGVSIEELTQTVDETG